MVTNDLTFQVAVDAIGQGVSVIVSYRMFILLFFCPLSYFDISVNHANALLTNQIPSSFLASSLLQTTTLNKLPYYSS